MATRSNSRPATSAYEQPSAWSFTAAWARRLSGLLMITATFCVGPTALAASDSGGSEPTTDTCAPPTLAGVVEEPGAPVDLASQDAVDPTPWTDGRWRRTARGPFGTAYAPAAWTGKRVLVVDRDTGRTATYRPNRDRWCEVRSAPRRVEPDAPNVWTGAELIIIDMARDGSSIGGLAYDPDNDRWRELAHFPFEAFDSDHSITAAIWTGSHVVVAEGFGLLAAYDPAADCWTEIGQVPDEDGVVWRLYQDDSRLLVESRTWDDVIMRAFDPAIGVWSDPIVSPLDRRASETGGAWADGSLVYVSWRDADEYDGAANAVFDPATMSWSAFTHECTTDASRSIEAGDMLVASNGRRALDGVTLTCVDLPKPTRALTRSEVMVWTGSELVAWAGLRSLPEPPRRDGLIFTPKALTE